MRRALILACLLVAALPADTARADQTDNRLPRLFQRLKAPIADGEARVVEAQIWQIWSESDDDEVNSMMLRGLRAMAEDNPRQAFTVFDAMVQRAPDFAEAWNKRATVSFVLGDLDASVSDIERTLRLEPHHFGALSGLGQIYLALDRKEAALKAFEAALAIDPHLTGVKAAVQGIKKQLEGDPT